MAKPKYNARALTTHLRELAAEAASITDSGDVITNAEAMSRLLWKRALGYSEVVVGDDGKPKEKTHAPEAWAIQMIYERLEGKVQQAQPDESMKMTAAEKVGDLSKNRINEMATAVVKAADSLNIPRPPKSLPPKLPRAPKPPESPIPPPEETEDGDS